jgi:thioredoxin 1
MDVTDNNFEQEVLASKVPVLVNFCAPWCTSCKTLAPVVEEVAGEFADRVKVVKVNTDENPSIAYKYKIRSIPTLMIFNEGQQVDMVVGMVPKLTLTNALEQYFFNFSETTENMSEATAA